MCSLKQRRIKVFRGLLLRKVPPGSIRRGWEWDRWVSRASFCGQLDCRARSLIEECRQPSDFAVGGSDAEHHSLEDCEGKLRLFPEAGLEVVVADDPKARRLDSDGRREVGIGVEERQGAEVISGAEEREGLAAKVRPIARDLNTAALDQVEVVLGLTFGEDDLSVLYGLQSRHVHQLMDMTVADVFKENDGSQDPVHIHGAPRFGSTMKSRTFFI